VLSSSLSTLISFFSNTHVPPPPVIGISCYLENATPRLFFYSHVFAFCTHNHTHDSAVFKQERSVYDVCFFWLSHYDPPKIFIVKAKMHALPRCFQPLSDSSSFLSCKGYLSAALTIKILGRERLFRQKKTKSDWQKGDETL